MKNQFTTILLLCIILSILFSVDLSIPWAIGSIFYVPVIMLAAKFLTGRKTYWFTIAATILTFIGYALNAPEDQSIRIFVNHILVAVLLWIIAILSMQYKKHAGYKEYLASIIDSSGDIIITKDLSSNITSWNKTAEQVYGYTKDEVVGQSSNIIIPLDKRKEEKELIKKIIKGEKIRHYRTTRQKKNGSINHVSLTLSPIKNVYGEIVGISSIGRDITSEVLTEKKLADAIEAKSRFVSIVSHELRTPLTAIQEGVGIVLDEEAGRINEEQKDFLSTAKRNIDRLSRLINDILDFQKIEAGKSVTHFKKNDIHIIVKEVYKTMFPLAKDKGLDFRLELGEDLPPVRCDLDKIIQVLTNLVNNAIKFTDHGYVSVQTKKDGNNALISVMDSGAGIQKNDLPKLFKPFELLGTKHTHKITGTGLGLAISKQIIDQHRGKIWAESEWGKGSRFHFLLPIATGRGA